MQGRQASPDSIQETERAGGETPTPTPDSPEFVLVALLSLVQGGDTARTEQSPQNQSAWLKLPRELGRS